MADCPKCEFGEMWVEYHNDQVLKEWCPNCKINSLEADNKQLRLDLLNRGTETLGMQKIARKFEAEVNAIKTERSRLREAIYGLQPIWPPSVFTGVSGDKGPIALQRCWDALESSDNDVWLEGKLEEARAEVWEHAIEEAHKERLIFLTTKDIEEGALDGDWIVLKIRKQMRNEIVKAMKALVPRVSILQDIKDKLEHARSLIGRLMWKDGLCVECTQENHDKPCQLSEELEKLEIKKR